MRTLESIRSELLSNHGQVLSGVVVEIEGGIGGIGVEGGHGARHDGGSD